MKWYNEVTWYAVVMLSDLMMMLEAIRSHKIMCGRDIAESRLFFLLVVLLYKPLSSNRFLKDSR